MTEGQANALLVLLKQRTDQWLGVAHATPDTKLIDRANALGVWSTYDTARRLVIMAMDGLLDERVYRKETPATTAE